MTQISDRLYSKIAQLSQTVIDNLRKKGRAIPTENNDGSIQLGNYSVLRDSDGYYAIYNQRGETVVDKLNLAQSAIVIANSLAVGRGLDRTMIERDREYGYALFEEQLLKQAAQRQRSRNPERADIMENKCLNSQLKRKICKKQIVLSFEKLTRLA